jgi:hypothetical protein
MTDQILPAFWRYPEEGKIIGRILAGYGELEFELADCLGAVLEDQDQAFRVMFRTRGEEQRIQTADALMRQAYSAIGFSAAYIETIDDLGWCKRTRNRYAHCHWYDTQEDGLCYFDVEGWAKKHVPLEFTNKKLNLPVLQKQEAYFRYVQSSLWHLQEAMKKSKNMPVFGLHVRPAKIDRPPENCGEAPAK